MTEQRNPDPFSQPVNPNIAHNKAIMEQQSMIRRLNEELDQKILSVFMSTEGDSLLKFWEEIYIKQPVIILNAPEGSNEMREGRNDFIRKIMITVQKAKEAK